MSPVASQSKVDKTKDNVKLCLCLTCPSYGFACQAKAMPQNTSVSMRKENDISDIQHLENMFCAFGKSNCIGKEKGCVCPDCQVHANYDLQEMYYCIQSGGK